MSHQQAPAPRLPPPLDELAHLERTGELDRQLRAQPDEMEALLLLARRTRERRH